MDRPLFLLHDHALDTAGGGAGARPASVSVPTGRRARLRARLHERLHDIDWVPDLGVAIGTRGWWRGLASCAALCAASVRLAPGLPPLPGELPANPTAAERDEARALAVAPAAWGGDTGRRIAAGDRQIALADVPERPSVQLDATLGEGDDIAAMLKRAGVAHDEAQAAARLIGAAVPAGDIAAGTRATLSLGRRPSRLVPRPLETLRIRARFDLALVLTRGPGGLAMTQTAIPVDRTPWRLQGAAGPSLYRTLRGLGVPATCAQDYLRALASRMNVGAIDAHDRFDLVIERDRVATGEVRIGRLLLAGLEGANASLRLMRWGDAGDADTDPDADPAGWWDDTATTAHAGEMGMPVAGHVTSSFGMRYHPILGFSRMHKGIDIGAPYGTPVHAAVSGRVATAGWSGGYGNFVRLAHAGGLATGYGHLARIAVHAGERVERGAVIGFVGATGLATGPHLHWEVWRGGAAVDPQSVEFDRVERLGGDQLRRFRARFAALAATAVAR